MLLGGCTIETVKAPRGIGRKKRKSSALNTENVAEGKGRHSGVVIRAQDGKRGV